jgi:hypothetical protein
MQIAREKESIRSCNLFGRKELPKDMILINIIAFMELMPI